MSFINGQSKPIRLTASGTNTATGNFGVVKAINGDATFNITTAYGDTWTWITLKQGDYLPLAFNNITVTAGTVIIWEKL